MDARRRPPVAVAAFVLAGSTAYCLNDTYDGPLMVAVAVDLRTLSVEGHLRAAVALAAPAVVRTALGTWWLPGPLARRLPRGTLERRPREVAGAPVGGRADLVPEYELSTCTDAGASS
ncbi:hypothetical protein [Streptomyces sp. SP17KL33]|uniref:hypothetical protein n=1 Tax=Streptomyces sp. SP17KL33 TaxID=3002534 RepID=UPI002E78C195|nr:hypothetical protein [Streptomyces sp. SP17KL33]MEE1837927.1 hypothetical protein [Streptomyces sp. SP17KL33]